MIDDLSIDWRWGHPSTHPTIRHRVINAGEQVVCCAGRGGGGRHSVAGVSRRRCAPEISFRFQLSRNRGE
jgi:hypothetical protein